MTVAAKKGSTLLAIFAAFLLAGCGSGDKASPPSGPTAGADAGDGVAREDDTPAADDADEKTGTAAAPATTAAASADGDPCDLTIRVGDNIAYSTNSLSVPASCGEVSVTITHTGKLPAAAMGHNWVLVPEEAVESIAMAGMNRGLENDFLPSDDDRIVAATGIVGGGESDTVRFSLDALAAGTNYVYVCTFPGHWSIMKGTFSVSG